MDAICSWSDAASAPIERDHRAGGRRGPPRYGAASRSPCSGERRREFHAPCCSRRADVAGRSRSRSTLGRPGQPGRIGLLSRQTLLYGGLSARENLEFFATLHGVAADRALTSGRRPGRSGHEPSADSPAACGSVSRSCAPCSTILRCSSRRAVVRPRCAVDPTRATHDADRWATWSSRHDVEGLAALSRWIALPGR